MTSRSPGKGCTCDGTAALDGTPGKRSDRDDDLERVPHRIEESLESIDQLFEGIVAVTTVSAGSAPDPTNPMIRGQMVTG